MHNFLLCYLAIGALILSLRLGYDCCAKVVAAARRVAAQHGCSVLRAVLTLLLCGLALVVMVVVLWPNYLIEVLRKQGAK
jgi:hypothetical protein